MSSGSGPVDGLIPALEQEAIRLTEMPAAEKSPVGRQRRWVRCREYAVFLTVYRRPLLLRMLSPKQENDRALSSVYGRYHRVSERLPSHSLM